MISVSVAGIVILAAFMTKPSIFIIGIFSVLALCYTLYMHLDMYKIDYRNFMFNTGIQTHATQILIFALVVLTFGFALSLPRGSPVPNLLGLGFTGFKTTTDPRRSQQDKYRENDDLYRALEKGYY